MRQQMIHQSQAGEANWAFKPGQRHKFAGSGQYRGQAHAASQRASGQIETNAPKAKTVSKEELDMWIRAI